MRKAGDIVKCIGRVDHAKKPRVEIIGVDRVIKGFGGTKEAPYERVLPEGAKLFGKVVEENDLFIRYRCKHIDGDLAGKEALLFERNFESEEAPN